MIKSCKVHTLVIPILMFGNNWSINTSATDPCALPSPHAWTTSYQPKQGRVLSTGRHRRRWAGRHRPLLHIAARWTCCDGDGTQRWVVSGGWRPVCTCFLRTDVTAFACAQSLTGIRSPPNMTRILNHWGLGPRLAKTAVKCPEFLFHQANGEVLGAIPLHEDFLRDLMADFLFLQHGELKTMLLSLATREGVEFRYNTEVEAVDGDAVSVRLSSGETVYADIVIGADGPDSKVRNLVAGETILGEKDGNMSLTMAIPTDRMRDDEDLRALTQGGKWWVWLGPNLLFHGSLISGGKLFSIVIGLRDVEPEKIAKYEESWENEYDINEFGIDWSAYDIRVQKMMKLVEKVTAIVHVKRPILESCVCDQARIVIVGEAAHPLVVRLCTLSTSFMLTAHCSLPVSMVPDWPSRMQKQWVLSSPGSKIGLRSPGCCQRTRSCVKPGAITRRTTRAANGTC
ncbi:unnamed protein product [Mycena citricolor]|uniref:FAD-binding domain-containing protein n=1 Tax=Mycena citricolor TaxID=2018698 RepID=A0AAD2GQW8_9AGAR|nr:unnamed protein product [Mycena citricolor]